MSIIDTVNPIPPINYQQPAASSSAGDSGAAFTSVLTDALKEEMTRVSIMSGAEKSSLSGGFAPIQTGGIEQAIIAAASSGEASQAQIALFMLCMMMQSDQDGDFSIIMQLMSQMLTQIEGDKEKLRQDVMTSDYDPYVLDTIDKQVFATRMPNGLTGQTTLPIECWKPAIPAITSVAGFRNPERYRAVIDQFRVESAKRYEVDEYTYCNIFLWDVTSAMGAEIPHYVDAATGNPRYYPDIKGATSMGAIATDKWLRDYGPQYGWYEVDAETAQRWANSGKPAVTTAGSQGHVQIVCPSRDGGYDPARGVTVAQAGRIVSGYTYITSIYGANGLNNIRYFVHE